MRLLYFNYALAAEDATSFFIASGIEQALSEDLLLIFEVKYTKLNTKLNSLATASAAPDLEGTGTLDGSILDIAFGITKSFREIYASTRNVSRSNTTSS